MPGAYFTTTGYTVGSYRQPITSSMPVPPVSCRRGNDPGTILPDHKNTQSTTINLYTHENLK